MSSHKYCCKLEILIWKIGIYNELSSDLRKKKDISIIQHGNISEDENLPIYSLEITTPNWGIYKQMLDLFEDERKNGVLKYKGIILPDELIN